MAYEVTMAWLASVCSGESGSSAIMCNLQSYKDMGLGQFEMSIVALIYGPDIHLLQISHQQTSLVA
jgi:hypothetical protein